MLDQNIDTSTPSGRFLFHSLAAVAELARDLIRERVVAAMAAANRRGKNLGRPVKLDRKKVAGLRRLHAAGHSQLAIAGQVGISKTTVSRALGQLRTQTVAA